MDKTTESDVILDSPMGVDSKRFVGVTNDALDTRIVLSQLVWPGLRLLSQLVKPCGPDCAEATRAVVALERLFALAAHGAPHPRRLVAAGRRRPADASCRADMWREDAVLASAGGANSSCGSAKGSSRTMPWRARPRPCYHEVAVAGRGRWRTDQNVAASGAVGRHAGAWCGLDDRGGRVAALHVREGRAPSFTVARAPAW